jgi:hypothetical protein
VDFSAFNTALASLLNDVAALVTAENTLVANAVAAGQAQVDAATAQLQQADATVQAVIQGSPNASSFGG